MTQEKVIHNPELIDAIAERLMAFEPEGPSFLVNATPGYANTMRYRAAQVLDLIREFDTL